MASTSGSSGGSWQKFSKVSSQLNLPYKMTILLTFEKFWVQRGSLQPRVKISDTNSKDVEYFFDQFVHDIRTVSCLSAFLVFFLRYVVYIFFFWNSVFWGARRIQRCLQPAGRYSTVQCMLQCVAVHVAVCVSVCVAGWIAHERHSMVQCVLQCVAVYVAVCVALCVAVCIAHERHSMVQCVLQCVAVYVAVCVAVCVAVWVSQIRHSMVQCVLQCVAVCGAVCVAGCVAVCIAHIRFCSACCIVLQCMLGVVCCIVCRIVCCSVGCTHCSTWIRAQTFSNKKENSQKSARH